MMNLSKLHGLFVVFILFSCSKTITPQGEIENKEVKVQAFSHLKLKGKFNLFYFKSDKDFLAIETYPNVLENLTIENNADTLLISEKQPTEKVNFYQVNVYTSTPTQSMMISDSVQVNTNHALHVPKLHLQLQDDAKFIGEIQAGETRINMTDFSLMNAKGKAEKVYLHIADTANFLSPYFLIDRMNMKAENQTYTEINVQDTIVGDIKNTSKVLYYNNPVRDFKIGDSTKVNHQKLN